MSSVSNFERFRMLVAYLFGGRLVPMLLELGISRNLWLAVQAERAIPDEELALRIRKMSERWDYGAIRVEDWPKPRGERRGRKTITRVA